jgi:type I restriction enzyme S subunit
MAYKQVLLGDYFKFEKGLGYKGEFLVEDSEVALIGMDSHEEGGGYKKASEKPYSGKYKSEHVAETGDVIFAATDLTQGGDVLGSPLMVPESDKFETFVYSHHLLKAFPKQDGFLPEYLYNLYRVSKFRRKVAYGDSGSTVRALPAEVLEEQIVPLPDLETQKSINAVIFLIDQKIENNKSLAKNLEALAQAIFRSWFVDFEPVHAKARGEKPFGMDEQTAAVFPESFEESEKGLIPKGWKVTTLKEACEIKQGRYLSPSQMKLKPSDGVGVPVIGGNGILGYTSKSTFEFGVPLITCRGSKCGLLQWGSFPSWISNNAMAVTFKHDPKDNGFLALLFDTLNFDDVITGSAQPQITITHLGLLDFVIPPINLIRKYTQLHTVLRLKTDDLMKQNDSLRDLIRVVLAHFVDRTSNDLAEIIQ